MMKKVLKMLKPINATTLQKGEGSSSDTDQWVKAGVPGVELYTDNENYFHFHHSNGKINLYGLFSPFQIVFKKRAQSTFLLQIICNSG